MRKYCGGDQVFVHMPGDVSGKAWKFPRPFHGQYRILKLTPSVRLVNKPQDTPIFMSLQRICMHPKEIPDEKTWSGQIQQRKRAQAAHRKIKGQLRFQRKLLVVVQQLTLPLHTTNSNFGQNGFVLEGDAP